jgi:hypothetical protein
VTTENVIGTVVTGEMVAAAIEDTIKIWSPVYLADVGVAHGFARGALAPFKGYVPAIDESAMLEGDQLPLCVIVAPGILDEPRRYADGHHEATWAVGVGAVVRGQNRLNSYTLATVYAAAIRTLLLQKGSLGGFAMGTWWLGERYDPLPVDTDRTLMGGIVQVAVDVSDVVSSAGGPSAPPPDPTADPGAWPRVGTVDVEIDRMEG